MNEPLTRIVAIVGGVCLAVSLFALGFAACAAQPTTRVLSTQFSDFATAPYGHDQLIDLAVATRDYTVDGISRDALYTQIAQAARTSASDESLGKTARWTAMATRVGLTDDRIDDSSIGKALGQREQYGLDETALSHLDDCYRLISDFVPWLLGIAVAAVAAIVALVGTGQRRYAGSMLRIAPVALGIFMVCCGIWAAIDFNGLFSVFHGILFPQGNWEFSADSLLICMLPLEFWVSMGAIWLAVTLAACIIAVIIGKRLQTNATNETHEG